MVDDGGSGFIVFLFGDSHPLEGREGSKDGTTNPDRAFSQVKGNNLDSCLMGRGVSSPAKPALHIPDPLSIIIAAISSPLIFDILLKK